MPTQPTEQQTKEILDRLEAILEDGNAEDFMRRIRVDKEDLRSIISRTLTAEAELQKAKEELEVMKHQSQQSDLTIIDLEKTLDQTDTAWKKALAKIESLRSELTSLRSTVSRMEGALKHLWNDGEMGWITTDGSPVIECGTCGHKAEAREDVVHDEGCVQGVLFAALQPAQSTPPLAQTAMDWDERLPYVPEKKTEGLPVQSAAKVEEQSESDKWAWSTNGENYDSEAYGSPMEAAAAGFAYMDDDLDEGRAIHVGRITKPDLRGHIHAESIIEHIAESECFDNDWADDWPTATRPQMDDLTERLQREFESWMVLHGLEPKWFTIEDDREVTREDVKAWEASELARVENQTKEEAFAELTSNGVDVENFCKRVDEIVEAGIAKHSPTPPQEQKTGGAA